MDRALPASNGVVMRMGAWAEHAVKASTARVTTANDFMVVIL